MFEWTTVIWAIYGIGVVIGGMYSAYRFGTLTSSEQDVALPFYVWLVILWPLLIVFLPFILMYDLGTKKRTKRLEKEYKDAGLL